MGKWITEAQLAADFWRALGIQQEWMNEPVQVSDDPIWRMTAKEGYLFDDAFWEVFEQFPFRICHVSYSGAPWSHEGGPPEMVLRFTLALPDGEDYRVQHERAMRDHILGGPDAHICDDLCSDPILDRLAGVKPSNEYPPKPALPDTREGPYEQGITDGISMGAQRPDTGLELTTAVVNPLDVERLARALFNRHHKDHGDCEAMMDDFYRPIAREEAAEYARLTSSPTAEPDWKALADAPDDTDR